MRRLSTTPLALLLALLCLWANSQGASGQDPKENAVKKVRLNTLYKAYQAHEVSAGKPAKKIDELALKKEDAEIFKQWLNLDELGVSVTGTKQEDLAKIVMAYEKSAPKDGGMVLFYDGAVKTLSADEVKKLVGKKDK